MFNIIQFNTNAQGQNIMALEVMNVSKFSKTIEEIVVEKRINYMDAIVWYCETNEMEVEVAANY